MFSSLLDTTCGSGESASKATFLDESNKIVNLLLKPGKYWIMNLIIKEN
jgi:hypothetical protein